MGNCCWVKTRVLRGNSNSGFRGKRGKNGGVIILFLFDFIFITSDRVVGKYGSGLWVFIKGWIGLGTWVKVWTGLGLGGLWARISFSIRIKGFSLVKF